MLSKEEIIKGNTEIKSKVLTFEQKEDTYPFFNIDFDYEVKIKSIVIYPGTINWTRLKNITVQVSQDGKTWEHINSICFLFKRKVVVHFRQYYSAQKCRIIFSDNKIYYHAKVNVKILGKKLLFLSSRHDGVGVRLLNLLNVMYFAKLTGNRFGFVWYDHYDGKFEATNVADEQKFFSPSFIEKYSYTKFFTKEIFFKMSPAQALNRIFNVKNKELQKNLFSDLFFMPTEHEWGWSFYATKLPIRFKKIDRNSYQRELVTLCKTIDFSCEVKQIKKLVDELYSNYIEYDMAVHFRSDDIVYRSFQNRFYFTYKGVIAEFFIDLLIKNLRLQKHIIIFTDSVEVAKKLVSQIYDYKFLYYRDEKWGSIIFSADLYNNINFINLESIAIKFFDIFLMSKLKTIYCEDSQFSELASYLGNSNLISICSLIKNDNPFTIIDNIRRSFVLDRESLAFSALWCFRNKTSIAMSKERWIDLLQQTFFECLHNNVKLIMEIDLRLHLKDYDFCENFLKKIDDEMNLLVFVEFAKSKHKQIKNIYHYTTLFTICIQSIKSHQKATINYPYIQKLCSYL